MDHDCFEGAQHDYWAQALVRIHFTQVTSPGTTVKAWRYRNEHERCRADMWAVCQTDRSVDEDGYERCCAISHHRTRREARQEAQRLALEEKARALIQPPQE